MQADLDPDDPRYQPLVEIDERRIMHFAKRHFSHHDEPERWNGRQIRNSFQVAYSLAQSNSADDSDDEGADGHPGAGYGSPGAASSRLDDEQFEIISETIEKFDRYLVRTRGRDADRARNLQLRNDRLRDFTGDEGGRAPHFLGITGPEQPPYPGPGPDLRLEAAPGRRSPRPSISRVSNADLDDLGYGTDQTHGRQKRRSVPQKSGGGSLSMRSPRSSTHLSPTSPMSRMEREFEYANPPLSNSEDFSDEDDMSRRGSVGGGAAKYFGRDHGYSERARGSKY